MLLCYVLHDGLPTSRRPTDRPRTTHKRTTRGQRRSCSPSAAATATARLLPWCALSRSAARPPARTQALFQHRPPSASLAPYEATRPFLSLSPTLLCTPLAEGGRKRKGGWNERKRLAPLASLALHPRPPKARASRRGKRGREAATATVSSVAMPSPLPPSSSSPNWREFLCFHNGGRARPARLPAPLPPSLPTPEPKPRRARIPRSDSPKVFGHGRTRALGCSFFPSLPRLPSTHALFPSFCVGGESTAVAAATAGKGDDGRPPSSPPSIYNTMYVLLLLPRLSSPPTLLSCSFGHPAHSHPASHLWQEGLSWLRAPLVLTPSRRQTKVGIAPSVSSNLRLPEGRASGGGGSDGTGYAQQGQRKPNRHEGERNNRAHVRFRFLNFSTSLTFAPTESNYSGTRAGTWGVYGA